MEMGGFDEDLLEKEGERERDGIVGNEHGFIA